MINQFPCLHSSPVLTLVVIVTPTSAATLDAEPYLTFCALDGCLHLFVWEVLARLALADRHFVNGERVCDMTKGKHVLANPLTKVIFCCSFTHNLEKY